MQQGSQESLRGGPWSCTDEEPAGSGRALKEEFARLEDQERQTPKTGTRLPYWRNQEVDKKETEFGSWEGRCGAQILEGLVGPGMKFGFHWLGVLFLTSAWSIEYVDES